MYKMRNCTANGEQSIKEQWTPLRLVLKQGDVLGGVIMLTQARSPSGLFLAQRHLGKFNSLDVGDRGHPRLPPDSLEPKPGARTHSFIPLHMTPLATLNDAWILSQSISQYSLFSSTLHCSPGIRYLTCYILFPGCARARNSKFKHTKEQN